MFRLSLAPVFGQEHQSLYDVAYHNPNARVNAPITERIEGILHFMDDKVPHYHSNASSLETALHMRVANCLSRAMLLHTLLSPLDDIEPIIELQRYGTDIHARNLLLVRKDSKIVELENGFIDIDPQLRNLTQLTRERIHPATITVVRPEQLSAATLRVRSSLYRTIQSGTGFFSYITSQAEQRLELSSKPEINDVTLLHRDAANMLIDSLSGAQRSSEHRKTYYNFMRFIGRPVSTTA